MGYSGERRNERAIGGSEAIVRHADIAITINTNITPSSEVELRTLRQALCLFLQNKWISWEPQDHNRSGSSDFWKHTEALSFLDDAQDAPKPIWNRGAPIMINLSYCTAAQSSSQSSIINHGNHPRSCEKVSSRHPLTFIFKISYLRSIKERSKRSSLSLKEITIKLFNPPRTSEIFMLVFQTSMLVHTHFYSI